METAQTGAVDGLAKFRPMVSEKPTTGGTLLQTGTTLNYKTLFLQRLANPTMAYDPISNPYRTVDWLPVDLTVFNGTDINQQDGTHGWNQAALPVDPANGKVWMNTNPAGAVPNAAGTYVAPYAPFDPDDPVAANDNAQGGTTVFDPTRYVRFYTRQRGGQAAAAPGAGTPGYLNLWTQTIASSAGSYLTDPSQSLPPSTGPRPWLRWPRRAARTSVTAWSTASAISTSPSGRHPAGASRPTLGTTRAPRWAPTTPPSPGWPGTTALTPAPGNC